MNPADAQRVRDAVERSRKVREARQFAAFRRSPGVRALIDELVRKAMPKVQAEFDRRVIYGDDRG